MIDDLANLAHDQTANLARARDVMMSVAQDARGPIASRLMAINAELAAMEQGTDPDAARAFYLPARVTA